LWDYDGTVVDTQPIWFEADRRMAAAYGLTWDETQEAALIGVSGAVAAERFLAATGITGFDEVTLDRWRCELVAEMEAAIDPPYLPGVRDLLAECRAAGLPCALVSASPRHILDAGLSRMEDWFAVTIAREDFAVQKPAPDGYLQAAAHLGVDPRACLVIEDSEPGCTAGRASGAMVLGIPNMTPLTPHPGQVIRDSLLGLRFADLSGLYEQAARTRA